MTAADFGAMVDDSGRLEVNPRMYAELAEMSLDFFDEAYKGMPEKGGVGA